MGYLEGLLGGFESRRREYGDQQLQLAREQSDRESKVFGALLSSPDPEIQALAATGMLTSAAGPQRKSGLRGWLGEMQSNPILGKIQALISQPTGPAALPSRSITGTISEPPSPSLAQPGTQTTTPGAPGPAATTPDQTPSPTQVSSAIAKPPQTVVPGVSLTQGPLSTPQAPHRQVFQTPEQAMLASKTASAQGDVEGMVAGLVATGMPRAEALKTVQHHLMRAQGLGAGSLLPAAGVDATGKPIMGSYDRRPESPTFGQWIDENENPIPGFMRQTISTPRSTDREGISRELFGKPFAQLTAPEAKQVDDRLVAYQGEKSAASAAGSAQARADAPLSTEQRVNFINTQTTQWNALQAPLREMQRQQILINTALRRYGADPVGASEAVITTFKKILDPGSVVRESEYARTPEGLSLVDRLQGMIDKYAGGGGAGVPEPILREMAKTADALVSSMNGWNEQHRQRIQNAATSFGVDPSLILGPGGLPQASAAAPGGPGPASPAVGAPPPGAPAQTAAAGPGSDWTMVNGVLHYKGKPY